MKEYIDGKVLKFDRAFVADGEPFNLAKLEAIETWVEEALTEAMMKGEANIVDYIEAECEWVKEDVHDGNNGYYKVYSSDIAKARTLPPNV